MTQQLTGNLRTAGAALFVAMGVGAAYAQQDPSVAALPAAVAAQATQTLTTAVQSPAAGEWTRFAKDQLRTAAKRTLVEAAVLDPMTTSGQSAAQHQVTVVAEKGDVVGKARFYLPLNENADLQLTFAAPLSSGAASFATADGLSPGASVAGAVKIVLWQKVHDIPAPQAVTTFGSFIGAVATARGSTTDSTHAAIEYLRQVAAATPPSAPAGVAAVVAAATPVVVRPELRRLLMSQTLVQSPERFYAALAQTAPALTSTNWTGYFTPGFESNHYSIDYLQASTFESATFDETKNVFTFAGGVSKVATWRTEGDGTEQKAPVFYAGVSTRLGHSASASDARHICRGEGTAGLSECFDLPVGTPAESTLKTITAELRQWSRSQTLGVNPRFTYSDVTVADKRTVSKTFEVPFYFMRKVKDITVPDVDFGADLIGGVSVGWRSVKKPDGTKEGAFVSVFLSKAFGLP